MTSSEARAGAAMEDPEAGARAYLLESRPDLALAALGGAEGLRAGRSTSTRVLRARVAAHLGAPRLALALDRGSFVRDRGSAAALVAYARWLVDRRGPHWTLGFLEACRDELSAEEREDPELLAFEARLQAELRDEVRAMALFERAEARAEGEAKVSVLSSWAQALDVLDAREEAIRRAEAGLERAPRYHFLVGLRADVVRKHRGVLAGLEAIRGLEESATHYALSYRRALYALELGRLDESAEAIARCRARASLADARTTGLIDSLELRIRLDRGERARLLELARALGMGNAFVERVREAERLPARVALEVPYVAQKYVTCAPATLTAIARYFGDPVDQEEVVEAMCFAGSPHRLQRRWCESRGYHVVDFTLTEEVGRALVDRGLPFLLVTNQATSSHAQCVRGYDPVTRDWLVMDPSFAIERRLDMDALEKAEAWTGPAAMVVLPASEVARLEGLELPEASARELLHSLDGALDTGDRVRARSIAEEIEAMAPDAPVSFDARLRLAVASRDAATEVEITRRWLEAFPTAERLVFVSVEASARGRRPREERLELLAPAVERGDPAMLTLYARELISLPGRVEEARRTLRRVVRLERAQNAYPIGLLGEIALREGNFALAARELRIANCIDEGYVWAARQYFVAANALGRSGEALAHLERRVRLTRARASEPAMTLFDAYRDAGRAREGLAALEALAAARPEDGVLVLACADAQLEVGSVEAAERWVEAAVGKTDPTAVASTRARCQARRGAPLEAARTLAAAIADDPFDVGARAAHLEYLAVTASDDELFSTCETMIGEAKGDPDILRAACPYLRRAPERARVLLEEYLTLRPDDAWARRELSSSHLTEGAPERALEVIEALLCDVPDDTYALYFRASALRDLGRVEEAYEGFRRTLTLDPDHEHAFSELVDTCPDAASLSAFAEEHVERLIARGTFGGGVRGMSRLRERLLDDDVLALVRSLREAFPELVVVFEVAAELALACGRTDECGAILEEGKRRFPDSIDLARIEIDLAHRLREFSRAVRIAREIAERSPMDQRAVVDLGTELLAAGEAEQAERLYRDALARGAYQPVVAQRLAELLDDRGAYDEAFSVILGILGRVHPSSESWDLAAYLGRRLGRLDEVVAIAESRLEAQPRRAELWLLLGQLREGQARIDAYERSVELNPRFVEAHDLLAVERVARAEYDLGRAHCEPSSLEGEIPVSLRGRRAWVDYEQGRIPVAIAAMREIVREAPNYRWGIVRLIEWTRGHGGVDERVEALRTLAALDRGNLESRDELGELLVEAGRSEEALEPLAEAVRLDPRVSSSLIRYVEVLASLGRSAEGRDVLAAVRDEVSDGVTIVLELALLEREEGPAAALARLERSDLGAIEPPLQGPVARVFRRAPEDLCAWLETRLRREGGSVEEARTLAELYVLALGMSADMRRGAKLLEGPSALGASGVEAVARYLEELAWSEDPAHHRLALRLVRRHRSQLGLHTRTWGAVGAVLTKRGRYRAAYRWLADFRTRSGVERWMMTNVVVVAMNLGRSADAREAALFGMRLDDDSIGEVLEDHAALFASASGEPVDLPPPDHRGLRRPVAELAALVAAARDAVERGDSAELAVERTLERVRDAGLDVDDRGHLEALLVALASVGAFAPPTEARPIETRLSTELGGGQSEAAYWASIQSRFRRAADGVERHLRTRIHRFIHLSSLFVALFGVPYAYWYTDGRILSRADGLVPLTTVVASYLARLLVRQGARVGLALLPFVPILLPLGAAVALWEVGRIPWVPLATAGLAAIPWINDVDHGPLTAARQLGRRREEAPRPPGLEGL